MGVRLELCLDPPVGVRHVREYLDLLCHQDRQRGRLYSARRPGCPLLASLETARQGAGRVHPDQPVRPGPTGRRGGEPVVAIARL